MKGLIILLIALSLLRAHVEEGSLGNKAYKYMPLKNGARFFVMRDPEIVGTAVHVTFNTKVAEQPHLRNMEVLMHKVLFSNAITHSFKPSSAEDTNTAVVTNRMRDRAISLLSKSVVPGEFNFALFLEHLFNPTFERGAVESSMAIVRDVEERERRNEQHYAVRMLKRVLYRTVFPSEDTTVDAAKAQSLIQTLFVSNLSFTDIVISLVTNNAADMEKALDGVRGYVSPLPFPIPRHPEEDVVNYTTNMILKVPPLSIRNGHDSSSMYCSFYSGQPFESLSFFGRAHFHLGFRERVRRALVTLGYADNLSFSLWRGKNLSVLSFKILPLTKGLERPLEVRSVLQYFLNEAFKEQAARNTEIARLTVEARSPSNVQHCLINAHYTPLPALFKPKTISAAEVFAALSSEVYAPEKWLLLAFDSGVSEEVFMPLAGGESQEEVFRRVAALDKECDIQNLVSSSPVVCMDPSELGKFTVVYSLTNENELKHNITKTLEEVGKDVLFRGMDIETKTEAFPDGTTRQSVVIAKRRAGIMYDHVPRKGSSIRVSIDVGNICRAAEQYAEALLYLTLCVQEFNRTRGRVLCVSAVHPVNRSVAANTISFELAGHPFFLPVLVRELARSYATGQFLAAIPDLSASLADAKQTLRTWLMDPWVSAPHSERYVSEAGIVACGYSPALLLGKIYEARADRLKRVKADIKLLVINTGTLEDIVHLYKDITKLMQESEGLVEGLVPSYENRPIGSMALNYAGRSGRIQTMTKAFFVETPTAESYNIVYMLMRVCQPLFQEAIRAARCPFSIDHGQYVYPNHAVMYVTAQVGRKMKAEEVEEKLAGVLSMLVQLMEHLTEERLSVIKAEIARVHTPPEGELSRGYKYMRVQWLHGDVTTPLTFFHVLRSLLNTFSLEEVKRGLVSLFLKNTTITISG